MPRRKINFGRSPMKILLPFLIITTALFSNPLSDSVEPLNFDPTGYFASGKSLDRIFRENEIKTVIELGSWAGASTRFFAHRVGEGGTVYAIDHWKGSIENRAEMCDPRLDHIFHLFLSNLKQAGVEHRVVPLRMTTDEAATAIRRDVQADLVFVDTAREEDRVYNDILNWYPFLHEEGIICGAEWREPAVRRAVKHAAHDLGKKVESDRKGFFWILK